MDLPIEARRTSAAKARGNLGDVGALVQGGCGESAGVARGYLGSSPRAHDLAIVLER